MRIISSSMATPAFQASIKSTDLRVKWCCEDQMCAVKRINFKNAMADSRPRSDVDLSLCVFLIMIKSVISQKLKYQVKTPSKHSIAWIASFKGLQAFRFFSGLFTVFNLSCIKKTVKTRSHRGESGLSRVVQVSLDSPYVLSQLHRDQSKSLSQSNQWDHAWEKETYLFTTRLLKAFCSNLFAVCCFW